VEAVASSTNVTTTYAYDNGNNRTSKSVAAGGSPAVLTNYTYNNLNQLTGYSDGTRSVTLTYDADGNRSGRTVSGGTDNGTDSYSYDFENRLIQLVKGTVGSAGTYNYSYDYRTRRIVRDESNAGGVVTDLVFSGGTSVQEYDTGGTGSALSVEYIRGSDYGGGVGGILYTLRGGTPSYTHENKRGDVVAKTDSSGNLTFQTQYEAFGKQVATSGSTLDRQKSNSKDTDPTGLVDEGFRYRDLDTGMFISRDPAGFVDGPNLYTYVVQNPWTKFDPEGLNAADENSKHPAQHRPSASHPSGSKQKTKERQPSPSAKKTTEDNKKKTGGSDASPPSKETGGWSQVPGPKMDPFASNPYPPASSSDPKTPPPEKNPKVEQSANVDADLGPLSVNGEIPTTGKDAGSLTISISVGGSGNKTGVMTGSKGADVSVTYNATLGNGIEPPSSNVGAVTDSVAVGDVVGGTTSVTTYPNGAQTTTVGAGAVDGVSAGSSTTVWSHTFSDPPRTPGQQAEVDEYNEQYPPNP
jgi:RHS repeat-associated protein